MILPLALAGLAAWAWRSRGRPMTTLHGPTRWVAELAETAGPIARAAGVPLSLALAQAALESAWGKRAPGHNLYGLKGTGPAGSVTVATTEQPEPGKAVAIRAKFRAFADDGQAVAAWSSYIKAPRNVPPGGAKSAGAWLAWYWSQGYATAAKYPQAVVAVSRSVAKRLGRPELAIVLSPAVLDIVTQLGKLPAAKRRKAAQTIAAKGWPA